MSAMIDHKTLTAVAPEPTPGLFALLREDVACVFQRDPAARTTWEVITTYPGIHALLWHRISHALWGRRWHYAARFLSFFARMFTQIDIHPGASSSITAAASSSARPPKSATT
jgi:serine O-acetyltransferase